MKLLRVLIVFTFLPFLQAKSSPAPTVAQAEEFMKQAEARLAELNVKVNHATWVQENFITEDTAALSADATEQMTAATTELV